MKFNVGDEVVSRWENTIGEIGTIVHMDGETCIVRGFTDGDEGERRGEHVYYDGLLDLHKKKKESAEEYNKRCLIK